MLCLPLGQEQEHRRWTPTRLAAQLAEGRGLGAAIVPGQPEKSRVMRAVEYVDEDLAMPPDGVLPKSEIALIRQWISRDPGDPF